MNFIMFIILLFTDTQVFKILIKMRYILPVCDTLAFKNLYI